MPGTELSKWKDECMKDKEPSEKGDHLPSCFSSPHSSRRSDVSSFIQWPPAPPILAELGLLFLSKRTSKSAMPQQRLSVSQLRALPNRQYRPSCQDRFALLSSTAKQIIKLPLASLSSVECIGPSAPNFSQDTHEQIQ